MLAFPLPDVRRRFRGRQHRHLGGLLRDGGGAAEAEEEAAGGGKVGGDLRQRELLSLYHSSYYGIFLAWLFGSRSNNSLSVLLGRFLMNST